MLRRTISAAFAFSVALVANNTAYAGNLWNLRGLGDVAIAVVQPSDAPVLSSSMRAQMANDVKAKLRGGGVTVVPHENSKAILDINLQRAQGAKDGAVLVQVLLLESVTVDSRVPSEKAEAVSYMDEELLDGPLTDVDAKVHDVIVNELVARFIEQYLEQKSQ